MNLVLASSRKVWNPRRTAECIGDKKKLAKWTPFFSSFRINES